MAGNNDNNEQAENSSEAGFTKAQRRELRQDITIIVADALRNFGRNKSGSSGPSGPSEPFGNSQSEEPAAYKVDENN